MRLIILGGPPSVGKTSVIKNTLKLIKNEKKSTEVIKLDSLYANDSEQYAKSGIKCIEGLSTYVCPDHFLASNLERITNYGLQKKLDYLVVESAGLCNRCSPHVQHNLAVTVLDMLSGINAPRKAGPLLKSANIVVLTKGDLISQAEREVFRMQISQLNRKAKILEINGLTGQGSTLLAKLFRNANEFDKSNPLHLKFTMPGAVCSFCLGEKRVGESYASGNVKLMDIPGLK
jgi:Ni2+-binding GTPase involved in maturation of urease and hydrogenase